MKKKLEIKSSTRYSPPKLKKYGDLKKMTRIIAKTPPTMDTSVSTMADAG